MLKTAFVLSFDRLPAFCLGCYGAGEATPGFDGFAAGAIAFDGHFAHHVSSRPVNLCDWLPLADLAERIESHAIVEATTFDDDFDFRSVWTVPDGDVAGAVNAACDSLREWTTEKSSQPRLLFVSMRGLPESAGPPTLDESRQSVANLDRELQPLFETLTNLESAGGECLGLITAHTGVRFAVRDDIPADFRLPDELQDLADSVVHLPLLVRSTRHPAGIRRDGLTHPADLSATLREWFGAQPVDAGPARSLLPTREPHGGREFVVTRDTAGNAALRNSEFGLLATAEAMRVDDPAEAAHAGLVRLFVRPDDPWNIHNVAAQEPETVADMFERLRDGTAKR